MAGTIIVSSIKTDTDNSFIVRSNTGATLFSVDSTSISIPDGSITSAMIANGTVIAADVADGSITTSKIADGNVTNAKIDSVANTKITGLITSGQIASVANTQVTGLITGSQLANTAVTAGTYGGSSNSALITVDAQGRITSASNVAAAGAQVQTQLFTAPGTWTNPGTVTQVRVTVIGGGGGGHGGNISGGLGGLAIAMVPVSAPVAITVGAGGAASTPAGTSSFGPAVSATGGAGGATPAPINVPGSGTVSVGTSLKTFVTSASVGIIFGELTNGTPTGPAVPATPYSTTSLLTAGARGIGAPLNPGVSGGVGGVVVVEWIG